MKIPAGTARRRFSGETTTTKGSFSSATAPTRQPGPTGQAVPEGHLQHDRAAKHSQVSPGEAGEGPAAAARAGRAAAGPGRGVPADAAAAAPPGSSVPPAAPGRGDAGGAALCGRGGLCSPRHRGRSVPGPRRRRARRFPRRSGQSRRAAGPRGAALPRAAALRGSPLRRDSRQGSAGAPGKRCRRGARCRPAKRGSGGSQPSVRVPAAPGGGRGAAPLRRSSSCRTRRWRWAAAAPST